MGKRKDDERPSRRPIESRPRWYCARTKLAQERKASVHLASQGFPVFMPIRTTTVSHGGKIAKVVRPLFPRYVFAQFDITLGLHGPISSTRGVSHLLCDASGEPHPIPDAVIDQIRRREELEKLTSGEIKSGFEPGDRIHLQVGPFAGFEATYLGESKGLASVIVFVFGRENALEIKIGRLPIGRPLANVA